jgi:hypothetical protein
MARYKVLDMSPRLLPVNLDAQVVPGSFVHALHHLVDALDLSMFDAHYRNDANGAPAHAPAMLLKWSGWRRRCSIGTAPRIAATLKTCRTRRRWRASSA